MDGLSNLPERVGTIGGTLLVVIVQITGGELVKTAVMAAVGAAVSFAVSWVLQRVVKRKGS
jgi:drug/metabolite transporter (DMT)-like permease